MAEAKTAAAAKKYHLGTGRRKTAVARVRLADGTGKVTINGRELNDYFTEEKDRRSVLGPLQLAEMSTKLDTFVKVHGGGFTGQAGAICQGVARALKLMFGLPSGPPPAVAEAAAGTETPGDGGFAKRLRTPPKRDDSSPPAASR